MNEESAAPNPHLAHPKSRGAARKAMRNRPTIDDVAAAAGVSRGTVSRVLNGAKHASAHAQAAVEKAIRDTGYVVNQNARGLVTQRSNAIAFVLTERQDLLFEDPNFNVLLRAATQALAKQDYALLLMIAGSADERDRVLRFIRAGHIDGVMLISTHGGDPVISEFEKIGLPMVACGRPIGHEGTIPFVAADDREGGRQMTRYLVAQGRKQIAIITGPLDTAGGSDRLNGYQDVLGDRFDGRLVVEAEEYSFAAGQRAMCTLLEQSPGIDAVFVASDLVASGAVAALRDAGRHVPHDVAVGGFDDSKVAVQTVPALTTIRQPLERVAAEMVEVLIAGIFGERGSSRLLPTQLVKRDSA
ncbi:MAG: LacI family DNA-binding transcriptional regulator [Mycobacteriales bacterium]